MNLLTRWFQGPKATPQMRPKRWIVVDCETSGLNPNVDRLLSIGAVAIDRGLVQVQDSFETVIRQTEVSDPHNIAIHGITGTQQRTGTPLAQAIEAFERWRADAPIVGWHVQFDWMFLSRAYAALGRAGLPEDTLDVRPLVQVLLGKHEGDLADIAARFGIACPQRHHAAVDAWITAQLLAVLYQRAKSEGVSGYHALRSLAKQAKWL